MRWPEAAVAYDREMRSLQVGAVALGRRFWRGVVLDDLSGSWIRQVSSLAPLVAALQVRAAVAGASYGASALAGQGAYEAPDAFVDPAGFAGVAPDGRPLAGALYSPITGVKSLIGQGMAPSQAASVGARALERSLGTMLADTGRAASSVDIAARPHVGYVRMLSLPSCDRCVALAGRFYRWNSGFPRHPKCDCRHIPTTESVAGDVTTDPYEAFKSMSEAEQDKAFGKANAQAIRDGGDMFRVVNSRRGMSQGGLVTKEGTSRRGFFNGSRRLTPERIYAQGLPREQTLHLLEQHGYILPGGQKPQGSIVGQREGFGQMGRGGSRVGASSAVLQARLNGVRDPRSVATMTAAERRVFEAQARWAQVAKGVNPFNPKRPLTPELAAAVENDFRRVVVLGDQSAKLTARQAS